MSFYRHHYKLEEEVRVARRAHSVAEDRTRWVCFHLALDHLVLCNLHNVDLEVQENRS